MTPRQILETWMQRVWAERNPQAIDELLANPCMVRGLNPDPIKSPHEFIQFHKQMLDAFSSIKISIEDCVSSGEFICSICQVQVVQTGTGKKGSFTTGVYCRIVNNKIVEASNSADFLSLLIQLGEVPGDILKKALTPVHLYK